ncbi:hypothetical protein [Cellulomonas sp. NPDC058312]|uniref:hypothetical protein n=1 Tax=Cellulomonas sp. NPDC058312 TaxID=3346441 RepID=UPI0036E66BED
MDLVVEPAEVAEVGAALRALEHEVPDAPRTTPRTSGSPAVDDDLEDLLLSARDGLRDARAALHALGTAASAAADALVATDRALATS